MRKGIFAASSLGLTLAITGCTYVEYFPPQFAYARSLTAEPSNPMHLQLPYLAIVKISCETSIGQVLTVRTKVANQGFAQAPPFFVEVMVKSGTAGGQPIAPADQATRTLQPLQQSTDISVDNTFASIDAPGVYDVVATVDPDHMSGSLNWNNALEVMDCTAR